MRTSIKLWRTLGALVLLAGFLTGGPQTRVEAQEVLTNDSVISMVKGGLGEAVVLARIRSSPANFDTSTNSLLALKKAGVSDKVIEAITTSANTGKIGDGKVFVMDLEQALRIRTGDRDAAAIAG